MSRATSFGKGWIGLLAEHRPWVIRARLSQEHRPDYLADAVLGAVDGSITTFATVAGAVGGGFSGLVVVILGLAKLLADGFSMAVASYLSSHSRERRIAQARRTENHHVERVPDGEREEIRQIFARKGFEGETLERVVATITANRELWVETMVREEHGLPTEAPDPLRAAALTFAAFLLLGIVPLVPFLIPGLSLGVRLALCGVMTAADFLLIGLVKGRVLGRPLGRSGVETLLTGGAAAGLAYLVGWLLRRLYGA